MWGNSKRDLLCIIQVLPAALFICKADMSHPFLEASIPELVKQLSTDEKISLLGAPNWWNTYAIPRLGIPSVRMSDGPNVRLHRIIAVNVLNVLTFAPGRTRIIPLCIYSSTVSSRTYNLRPVDGTLYPDAG